LSQIRGQKGTFGQKLQTLHIHDGKCFFGVDRWTVWTALVETVEVYKTKLTKDTAEPPYQRANKQKNK
jgi:hypothetical protein